LILLVQTQAPRLPLCSPVPPEAPLAPVTLNAGAVAAESPTGAASLMAPIAAGMGPFRLTPVLSDPAAEPRLRLYDLGNLALARFLAASRSERGFIDMTFAP
jgi:hypothetical protein